MTDVGELDAALDALIERFGSGAHAEEIVRAREEYAERTGRVFEDDELYEARTASFLEWYVAERPLEAEGVAPAVVAFREAPTPVHRAWATTYRSLFAVEELEPGRVVLFDLLGGGRFAVVERRRLHGVAAGDLVEARLCSFAGEVRFGRTFCYHPPTTRAALIAQARHVRAAGGSRIDAVDHAAALCVRALRYRHVAPERVYEMATSELTLPPRPETLR